MQAGSIVQKPKGSSSMAANRAEVATAERNGPPGQLCAAFAAERPSAIHYACCAVMREASGTAANSDGSAEPTTRRVQDDDGEDYQHELRVFEKHYARRRRQFLAQRQREDTSTARVFVLSDDKPWEVFGHATSTQIQRRKLVFEACVVFPALHEACASGDRVRARALLSASREYEREQVCALARDACGRVALHHAIVGEHINIAKRLLRRRDAKLQVHARDNSKRTPLHYVLQKMELLARAWCRRKDVKGTPRRPPVFVTAELRAECKRYRRLWELADRMTFLVSPEALQSGPTSDSEGGESIEEADLRCRGDVWDICHSGDLERLETLFKISGHRQQNYELQSLKRTLLHEACEAQQIRVVDFLLSTREASVLARDTSGCTALHCAARRGSLEICQLLLAGEISLDSKNTKQFHVQNGATEALTLCQDLRGRTALHWCLLANIPSTERSAVAAFLAESCPSSLHLHDDHGVGPLHLAIERGDLNLVQRFVYLGSNVDGHSGSDSLRINRVDIEREKASWAPCGQVFQPPRRFCRGVEVKKVPNTLPSGLDTSMLHRKGAFASNDVQHPVELLWYWTQKPKLARKQSPKSSTHEVKLMDPIVQECKGKSREEDGEELGCRKYGGICDSCKLLHPRGGGVLPPRGHDCRRQTVLSPLTLALRMCTLKGGTTSSMGRREKIAELLLKSGANPEGTWNDNGGDGRSDHMTLCCSSSLSESLRASAHCPRLLPTVLVFGSKRISMEELEWVLSEAPSTEKNGMETVLMHLLELDHVAKDRACLLILFRRQYFHALLALVEKLNTMERMSTAPENRLDECNASGNCDQTHSSPWKVIQEYLASRDFQGPIRMRRHYSHLELEHLSFLSVMLEKDPGRGDDSVWHLLEFCMVEFLVQNVSASFATRVRENLSDREIDKREQVLLHCIRQLLVRIPTSELGSGGEKTAIMVKLRTWLAHTVRLGCFQCALVLLEMLARRSHERVSLDALLEHYAAAKAVRTYREDRELRFHREFISVCTEKLLLPSLDSHQHADSPPSPNVDVSMRSFVHLCAFNLPFAIIARCLRLLFHDAPEGFVSGECDQIEFMYSIRVEARTVCQWIVVHSRVDIMEVLLAHLPEGPERTRCWHGLVAAAGALCTGRSTSQTKLLDSLFALYSRIVVKYLSDGERKALLINLTLKVAIPLDSVPLVQRLVDHLQPDASPAEDDDAKIRHDAIEELEAADFVHAIARWNAVQIADFWLGRRSQPSDELDSTSGRRFKAPELLQRLQEIDGCTPLELARMLGHCQLHHLFVVSAEAHTCKRVVDTIREYQTPSGVSVGAGIHDANCNTGALDPPFGLVRHIVRFNENAMQQQHDAKPTDLCRTLKRSLTHGMNEHLPSISTRPDIACALNQVSHLRAMALLTPVQAEPDASLCDMVRSSINHGSIDALRWLLAFRQDAVKALSDSDGAQCLQTAARHSSDTYAEMTLLLLESGLHPGRLAGDGLETPLLHRAACFSNNSLARRAMSMLLDRSDCDINALDAFGTPAVVHALASGCLENACFLIVQPECRLEAEYEGQTSFYYSLHLMPSFPSRAVVRELLVTKRSRAFLHCEAKSKSCGCKGFETPPGAEAVGAGDGTASCLCGFCNHELSSHSLLPLPSWFRDQYDTYLGGKRTPRTCRAQQRSLRNTDCSASEDEDNHRRGGSEEDAEDEMALESRCGRLDVSVLARITAIRYDDLLQANELHLMTAQPEPREMEIPHGIEAVGSEVHTAPARSDGCAFTSYWPMLPLHALDEADGDSRDVLKLALLPKPTSKPRHSFSTQVDVGITKTCAWSLREEIAMVHPPTCSCQSIAFATSEKQLVHVVVCRWLRHTASSNTSAQLERSHSLASLQLAFTRWQARETTKQAGNESMCSVEVEKTAKLALDPHSSGVLHAAVAQWQYARAFGAFQRWKNHRSSAEVAHHRLATRLEQLAADMRHQRFLTLQLRQQQLQAATQSFRLSSP